MASGQTSLRKKDLHIYFCYLLLGWACGHPTININHQEVWEFKYEMMDFMCLASGVHPKNYVDGLRFAVVGVFLTHRISGINLCMRAANERRRYIVTSSPIGWVHIFRGCITDTGDPEQNKTQKRKGCLDGCPSSFSLMTRAVTLTTFPLQWRRTGLCACFMGYILKLDCLFNRYLGLWQSEQICALRAISDGKVTVYSTQRGQ